MGTRKSAYERYPIYRGKIAKLTVTKPHSLSEDFLQELLKIVLSQTRTDTRALIFMGSHPEALVADVAELLSFTTKQAIHFLGHVATIAEAISTNAPLALSGVKALIMANRDMPLDHSNKMERQRFASLFGTRDQKEGMAAFLEKRPAQFRGE